MGKYRADVRVSGRLNLFTVTPNFCGFSVMNLFHVTRLVFRIFWWFLDFFLILFTPTIDIHEMTTLNKSLVEYKIVDRGEFCDRCLVVMVSIQDGGIFR